MNEPIYLAKAGDAYPALLPAMANRHGLIAGATGTGKTVTLQSMAERLSFLGVPIFMADVKGDLSGIGAAGVVSAGLQKRLDLLGLNDFVPFANTISIWNVWGEKGIPIRATISDMGPLLLSRLLNLNETQSGVLNLVFRIADDQGLLLIDLKDLRALLQYVGENAKSFTTEYGNVSSASIGAIQRGLLTLESQGGEHFFGEPMLDVMDLIQQDSNGRGVINILAADQLINSPALYSTFLLWLLSELYEQLPEAGDLAQPKFVFFFDEAHLLFNDASTVLIEKIEQVVRLIRSKGVGIYFVTQNPLDIPDTILGQLGNRVQHALRAFTPRDQKAVKTAAQTMRANPAFSAEEVITELGVGEALVSFLDEKGRPSIVERALLFPPASRIGPLSDSERQALIADSPFNAKYGQSIDRASAYETLHGNADAPADSPARPSSTPAPARPGATQAPSQMGRIAPRLQQAQPQEPIEEKSSMMRDMLLGSQGPRGGRREGVIEAVAKSAARGVAGTIGREIGKQVLRGVLGSIFGGRR